MAGWRFLQRTGASQQAAFETSATIRRDVDYFREKIGSVTSATELVADRRLLKVALGAFGLEGDIDKKAFVRRVLEENLLDVKALANRLTAPAYKDMAEAFGFGGLTGAQTGRPGFAEGIVAAYKTRAFRSAVGEVNDDMRLALNFRREIADLSAGETGEAGTASSARTPCARSSRRPTVCRPPSASSTWTASATSCATRPRRCSARRTSAPSPRPRTWRRS